MFRNNTIAKKFLIGPALGAILGAGILIGCTNDTEGPEGAESNHVEASESVSGRESGGEHGSGGEGSGSEGSESGSEEGSGAMLAPDQTFDMVRGGARLIRTTTRRATPSSGPWRTRPTTT